MLQLNVTQARQLSDCYKNNTTAEKEALDGVLRETRWRRNSTNFQTSTSDIFLTKLIGTRKRWKLAKVSKIFHMNYTCILTGVPPYLRMSVSVMHCTRVLLFYTGSLLQIFSLVSLHFGKLQSNIFTESIPKLSID